MGPNDMNDRLSKDPAYRRLPTGRRTPNQHLSCWLARDHLLVVEGMGYSERYSRFDLRDIQAVLIQPSGARQIVAMVAGLAAVPALALVGLMLARWLGTRDNDYLVGLVLISAASLAPLVALAWAAGCGPLCHVRISTAVQVAKLPGLHQRTKARAFATALRDAAVALSPIAPASAAVAAPDAPESRPA
jgi:hypothetical protein